MNFVLLGDLTQVIKNIIIFIENMNHSRSLSHSRPAVRESSFLKPILRIVLYIISKVFQNSPDETGLYASIILYLCLMPNDMFQDALNLFALLKLMNLLRKIKRPPRKIRKIRVGKNISFCKPPRFYRCFCTLYI